MFSREVKQGLLDLADVTIFDVMGSTEGGMELVGRQPRQSAGRYRPLHAQPGRQGVRRAMDREVTPGSDEIGMVASAGAAQMGYYKDETKTAATFRVIGGVRYSFPAISPSSPPMASLILLGRGSVCINTGGEKVYPEEVEEALKAHPERL